MASPTGVAPVRCSHTRRRGDGHAQPYLTRIPWITSPSLNASAPTPSPHRPNDDGPGVLRPALPAIASLDATRLMVPSPTGVVRPLMALDGDGDTEGPLPSPPAATTLARARPSSTLRAREANSREHLDSDTFSAAGETLTIMMHLELPPRESSSSRVSCSGGCR